MFMNKYIKYGLCLLLLVGTAGLVLAADWTGALDLKPPFSAPNPFYDGMDELPPPLNTIKFVYLPKNSGVVELKVYSVSGNLVGIAFDLATGGDITPDYIEWDGKNWAGVAVAKGAYLYVITITDASGKIEVFKGICFKV
jgi:hypothetical protein